MEALAHLAATPPAPRPELTRRERDVLALLMVGEANMAIAAHLGISHGTVRLHVSNILSKLGVNNRTEAALLAVQSKLVP